MAKKPVLLTTCYLPPAGWFSLLDSRPVVLEKHETYTRQSYRNRCHIGSERGMLPLSVPVNKPNGNHTRIDEVQIFNGEKWYLKHWRAIQSAYESSPFFLYYADDLKPFFTGKHRNLWKYNLELIETLCSLTDISPDISFTESFKKESENVVDLRTFFTPKKPVQGTFPPYTQVFSDRHGFLPGLSILDVIFNLGPETKSYLSRIRLPF